MKRLKERNRHFAVRRLEGAWIKDWQKAAKKYSPAWAVWVSNHIPLPRKRVLQIRALLNACPLSIVGGMLHWSLARMGRAKAIPKFLKPVFAITVVLLSFPINAVACLSCSLRFPLRWILLEPVLWFQGTMNHLGVGYRIYERENMNIAYLEIRKTGIVEVNKKKVFRINYVVESFPYNL